jgi:hypothetical protein
MNLTTCLAELKALAVKTIEDCTFEKTVTYFGKAETARVLLPSGDEKYAFFWVRDSAMMAESGLVADEDLKRYIEIIALCGQNGPQRRDLLNGLWVPAYAVTDHINYEGGAVYYPGVGNPGDNQGTGKYGILPPLCDNYYFILMVGAYVAQTGDKAILENTYKGLTLAQRLEYALAGYNIDPETQLCTSTEERFAIDWGFVDTIKKSGKLLMSSLLRCNAARTLYALLGKQEYLTLAEKIEQSVLETFYDDKTGWFWSATGIGHQYDVWATAYAVFLGIAKEQKTLEALYEAYADHTAVVDGYVRHIRTTDDYSEKSAWEFAISELNSYQNGGYWATPTGWYAYALYLYNGEISILEDFLNHTKKFAHKRTPVEWMTADTSYVSGLNYGTSGALPYIGAVKIATELS